jgi:hypothetical protein
LNHPQQIFITHTHGDHIANLPFTLIGAGEHSTSQHSSSLIVLLTCVLDLHLCCTVAMHVCLLACTDELTEPTHIYAPAAAEGHIINYINALFEASSMRPIADLMVGQADIYSYHGYDTPTTFRTSCNKTILEVSVVLCDHAIPTISYCFSEVKTKLKSEYKHTPGQDIGKLRKSGVTVTEEVVKPAFAFICDTSIQILTDYPDILSYPVVFIECTFLYPEERANAEATKHIHWMDLKPFVLAHPGVLFVLMHFSLRYKDVEILKFFEKEQSEERENDDENNNNNVVSLLSNIKVWAGDTSI